jgi:hypothetical protein
MFGDMVDGFHKPVFGEGLGEGWGLIWAIFWWQKKTSESDGVASEGDISPVAAGGAYPEPRWWSAQSSNPGVSPCLPRGGCRRLP